MEKIKIPIRLDETAFRKFGVFDNITLNKRWRPSAAGGIFLAAAGVLCLVLLHDIPLAGGLLLCLGLGLPINWLIRFYRGMAVQVKQNGLTEPKLVYNVILTPEGVQQWMGDGTDKAKKSTVVPWEKVYGAWHTEDAVYLYVLPNRALLFPAGLIPMELEQVWSFLEKYMASDNLHRMGEKE